MYKSETPEEGKLYKKLQMRVNCRKVRLPMKLHTSETPDEGKLYKSETPDEGKLYKVRLQMRVNCTK